MTRLEIDHQQEYQTRILVFHIEVKNNCGVPTKFVGTQEEFDLKFKPFTDYDTYGKIIDIEKEDLKHKEEQIRKDVKRNKWGEDISEGGLNRSNTNKRYWKYL
jgi:hypothetical protein